MGEQVILHASLAFGGGEDIFPGDVALAQRRGVALRVRRTIREQQAVGLAGVLFDERHHVRAGAGGHVDVGMERQVLGLRQDIDRAADAVAPGLELHRMVVEADHHAVPVDGFAGGLEHVRQFFPGVGFVGCLDGVVADLSPAATAAAFLGGGIRAAFPSRRGSCAGRVVGARSG